MWQLSARRTKRTTAFLPDTKKSSHHRSGYSFRSARSAPISGRVSRSCPFSPHSWPSSFIGIIVIARREQRKGSRPGPGSGLPQSRHHVPGRGGTYLVQMFRVFQITGVPPSAAITMLFAAIPVVLGIITLRLARGPGPHTIRDRIALLLIGVIGLVFWAGLIIGPACALIAALVPGERLLPEFCFPFAPGLRFRPLFADRTGRYSHSYHTHQFRAVTIINTLPTKIVEHSASMV